MMEYTYEVCTEMWLTYSQLKLGCLHIIYFLRRADIVTVYRIKKLKKRPKLNKGLQNNNNNIFCGVFLLIVCSEPMKGA
jgi:hypothetical protein